MIRQKNRGLWVILLMMALLVAASLACRFSSGPEPTPTMEPTEPAAIIATEVMVTLVEEPDPVVSETVSEPEEAIIEEGLEPAPRQTTEISFGPEISIEEIIQVDQTSDPMIFRVGDVLSSHNQIFMVLGWEIAAGDEFFKPDPGFMFVAVDMIVVNTNPEPILISSLLQTDLSAVVNGETQDYSVSILAQTSIKSGMIDGNVLPGERLRAKVGFLVPENVSGMVFYYLPEFLFSEQVAIALGAEPGLLSPPAAIPGELALTLYPMGELIELNDVSITINDTYQQAGRQFFEPSEGYKFIIVKLSLKNQADSTVTLSSDNFLVKDLGGLRYHIDISATGVAGGNLPDGNLNKSETVQFTLGYEVPEHETQFQFVFDASQWDAGKISIDLLLE